MVRSRILAKPTKRGAIFSKANERALAHNLTVHHPTCYSSKHSLPCASFPVLFVTFLPPFSSLAPLRPLSSQFYPQEKYSVDWTPSHFPLGLCCIVADAPLPQFVTYPFLIFRDPQYWSKLYVYIYS